jgi:hypothetical protein
VSYFSLILLHMKLKRLFCNSQAHTRAQSGFHRSMILQIKLFDYNHSLFLYSYFPFDWRDNSPIYLYNHLNTTY